MFTAPATALRSSRTGKEYEEDIRGYQSSGMALHIHSFKKPAPEAHYPPYGTFVPSKCQEQVQKISELQKIIPNVRAKSFKTLICEQVNKEKTQNKT